MHDPVSRGPQSGGCAPIPVYPASPGCCPLLSAQGPSLLRPLGWGPESRKGRVPGASAVMSLSPAGQAVRLSWEVCGQTLPVGSPARLCLHHWRVSQARGLAPWGPPTETAGPVGAGGGRSGTCLPGGLAPSKPWCASGLTNLRPPVPRTDTSGSPRGPRVTLHLPSSDARQSGTPPLVCGDVTPARLDIRCGQSVGSWPAFGL